MLTDNSEELPTALRYVVRIEQPCCLYRPDQIVKSPFSGQQRLLAQVLPVQPEKIESIEHGRCVTVHEGVMYAAPLRIETDDLTIQDCVLNLDGSRKGGSQIHEALVRILSA